ncbi:tryptophan synthase beta subunit-like PLP-dependent enzyme [Chytridium lagenaria]|nr:tryptophan synthase beta subunit-like PLP-dependent enzyme [Chytridium lagenaria]
MTIMKSLPSSWIALFLASLAVGVATAFHSSRRSKKNKPLRICKDIRDLVGNTPIVRIKSLSDATGCDVFAKLEFLNIGGSLKDRLALRLIKEAESNVQGQKPMVVVEGTVGSTGISLATLAKASGIGCYIVMPDDQALEKYSILEQLGATVERVRPVSFADPGHFVHVAKRRAEEMNLSGNTHAVYCNQFDNLLNFEAHFTGTGPEILDQMEGNIDYFIMGAGTGGTIGGISHFLKPRIPKLKVILSDPFGSSLFNKVKHGVMYASTEAEGSRKRHQVDSVVEGIGINRITRNFEKAISHVDDAVKVSDEEALQMSRFLLENDGLFVGSSSAVNAVAAYKMARESGPGKRILTIFCDHGSRHLTKFWNPNYLTAYGFDTENIKTFNTTK